MAKKLVIVESPAKTRTLGRILGSGYSIKASLGHVRDLPRSALGVDIENDFAPKYLVPKEKKRVVKELEEAAGGASAVYLATDPDREGEAISWHLVEAAHLDRLPIHRVVFNEITERAVKDAFRHPRSIDMNLVLAQQTRRILDRLVGYKVSPLLWRKVQRGLSAGRVQSAALKMVVDREREIESFVPVEYWTIDAELRKRHSSAPSFRAQLVGLVDGPKLEIRNQGEAEGLVGELEGADYVVAQVGQRPLTRGPAPPFITSTLQQEAWRRFGFSAEHTMAIAQQLYEGMAVGDEGQVGLITYMRTDSTRVAAEAITETRDFITQKYGPSFLPPRPRSFARKVKGAQEAHEAIRPTKIARQPEAIRPYLSSHQFRLYELIWKRMVASQMAPARFTVLTVEIEAQSQASGAKYLLRASSSRLDFPGFITLYQESRDEEAGREESPLPHLDRGESLELEGLFPEQHFTQPPARYTEATLIRALEERGIGRPSTYAPILSTIKKRSYVEKVDGRFRPQELGLVVADLMDQHFRWIVDLGFTALVESKLDQIAQGKRGWVPMMHEFYTPFKKTLEKAASRMEKVKVADEPTGEACPNCGRPLVIKTGRYGRFVACSGFPECKTTKPLQTKIGVACPECGGDLVQKVSKKKRTFYGCANFPRCSFAIGQKPLPQPCPRCGGLLTQYRRHAARCQKCQQQFKLGEIEREPAGV
ncbi:MAG: type I DNA topoisomerase, partial [Dehalococcoidia bacterium]